MPIDKKRFFHTNVASFIRTARERCVDSVSVLVGRCCVICDVGIESQEISEVFCNHCLDSVGKSITAAEKVCQLCGLKISGRSINNKCKACIIRPPAFNQLHAMGEYEGMLAELIIQAKIAKRVAAIVALKELVTKHSINLANKYPDHVLLAMPTPHFRLFQRGFNVADIIAAHLSNHYALQKLSNTAVMLPFYVSKQAKMNRKERLQNSHNFRVMSRLPKNIIIIDDIVTTTTTVNQLAKMLRIHGVEKVIVWAVLRTQSK